VLLWVPAMAASTAASSSARSSRAGWSSRHGLAARLREGFRQPVRYDLEQALRLLEARQPAPRIAAGAPLRMFDRPS
jgi:hypothetical protein